MFQRNNWWALQFVESLKELSRFYDRFCVTREIKDFDNSFSLREELNEAYELSLDLLDFVKLGRALRVGKLSQSI